MYPTYLSTHLAQVLPVMVVVLVPVYSAPCLLILQSENDNAAIESCISINDHKFHE